MQLITVPEKVIMKIFEMDNRCSSQLDAPTTALNPERMASTRVWANNYFAVLVIYSCMYLSWQR